MLGVRMKKLILKWLGLDHIQRSVDRLADLHSNFYSQYESEFSILRDGVDKRIKSIKKELKAHDADLDYLENRTEDTRVKLDEFVNEYKVYPSGPLSIVYYEDKTRMLNDKLNEVIIAFQKHKKEVKK